MTAYVIDSGIVADHRDFGGRVRSGFTAIDDGRGTRDCAGHGTHVAGTIGGAAYGVAPAVSLVAVRTLDCEGSGETSGVIAGIDWAARDHPAGTPAVANLSLSGPAGDNVDAAIRGLVDDGVTVAVAAGNEDEDACDSSPAREPAALTVAATDRDDRRASFSNRGSCVDLFAPGVDIVSDWYTGDTATEELSGTSMAAPHVAGAAALLLGADPGLTPAQVADRLLGSATAGVVRGRRDTADRLLYVAPPAGTDGPRSTPAPVIVKASTRLLLGGIRGPLGPPALCGARPRPPPRHQLRPRRTGDRPAEHRRPGERAERAAAEEAAHDRGLHDGDEHRERPGGGDQHQRAAPARPRRLHELGADQGGQSHGARAAARAGDPAGRPRAGRAGRRGRAPDQHQPADRRREAAVRAGAELSARG